MYKFKESTLIFKSEVEYKSWLFSGASKNCSTISYNKINDVIIVRISERY